jgi:hypothetical protein
MTGSNSLPVSLSGLELLPFFPGRSTASTLLANPLLHDLLPLVQSLFLKWTRRSHQDEMTT